MPIHVIGLGGRESLDDFRGLLTGAHIVARSRQVAEPLLPSNAPVRTSFDACFESEIRTGLAGRIAGEVMRAVDRASNVVYLVPGSGMYGDVTVASLARTADISIHPGRHTLAYPTGQLQIVDALELAEAELAKPFDAGIAPLDGHVPLLVTNLSGSSVVELATRRLRRTYPDGDFTSTPAGELVIDAMDPLDLSRSLSGFEQIIARLRSPEGCPWDREQTAATLHPQLLEEVEELGEAIQSCDARHIAEELGDVLLHIVMIAQIAREEGHFDLNEVVAEVSAKMVRRHPHVFGDVEINSIDELYENWDRIKAAERSGGESD